MAHLSEGANSLQVREIGEDVFRAFPKEQGLELIILPYIDRSNELVCKNKLYNHINGFINNSHEETVVAILTSPAIAADFCNFENSSQHFKLWVPVRLEHSVVKEDYIDKAHAALVFFAKYKQPIKHIITRVSYTHCPFCEKTTKDYGGKKHLYDRFGTLMSDVWRDIRVGLNSESYPVELTDRLKDLFGLENYSFLNVRNAVDYVQLIKVPRINNLGIQDIALINESTLYLGDSIEILKQIPDNSIDFCFADPPYNIKKKYQTWNDALDIKEYFDWCDNWLSELARILKPGRTVAILNIPQWSIRHFKHLNQILEFQDWIVWEGLSLPSKKIVPINYTILCFSKGDARPLPFKENQEISPDESLALSTFSENYCLRSSCITRRSAAGIKDRESISNIWWGVHRLMHDSRREDHPCQLPPALMNRLISMFTKSGEVVLDPFNGVGTTTLCAHQLGRKYIGIELSDYYHNITVRRHQEIVSGVDPFRKRTVSSEITKNSRVKRVKKKKHQVSKKEIQLEVKAISAELGRLPNKDELFSRTIYPIEYYDLYFTNWADVYAAARSTGMSENKTEAQLSIF